MAGSLAPWGGPILRRVTIANSVVLVEEDTIEVDAAGDGVLGTSANALLGHARSIVTFDGVGVIDNGAGAAFVGTYTMASDNITVAEVSATVDLSKHTLYSAEVDVAIATTTGSDLLGYYMDLVDENTLDESTAATTAGQYFNHGLDPVDSTRAFVNLFESSYFGPL